jgi:hypothetical protein
MSPLIFFELSYTLSHRICFFHFCKTNWSCWNRISSFYLKLLNTASWICLSPLSKVSPNMGMVMESLSRQAVSTYLGCLYLGLFGSFQECFGTQPNLGLDLVPHTLHTAWHHKLCHLIAPLIKSHHLTARHVLIVTCDYMSTKFLGLWQNSWENSVFLVYILHKEGSECALPGLYADSALKINTSDLPVMCGALNTP